MTFRTIHGHVKNALVRTKIMSWIVLSVRLQNLWQRSQNFSRIQLNQTLKFLNSSTFHKFKRLSPLRRLKLLRSSHNPIWIPLNFKVQRKVSLKLKTIFGLVKAALIRMRCQNFIVKFAINKDLSFKPLWHLRIISQNNTQHTKNSSLLLRS